MFPVIFIMLIIAPLLFLSSCQKSQDKSSHEQIHKTVVNKIDVLEETKNILLSESRFHQPEVSYNENSGLTYDGILINPETGQLLGSPRKWSAASKEALHIQLLSMTVAGKDLARSKRLEKLFYSGSKNCPNSLELNKSSGFRKGQVMVA
jgi:hypothetical protein